MAWAKQVKIKSLNKSLEQAVTDGSIGGNGLKYTEMFWVSGVNGNDTTGDGSFNKPFKTIQKAITTSAPASSSIIKVFRGTYNEVLDINNKTNLMIEGFGCNGSCPVDIIGNGSSHKLRGTSTRLRLKNLIIKRSDAGPCFEIQGTSGRHYFHNVAFQPLNDTNQALLVNGAYTNWLDATNCDFLGRVTLEGSPTGNPSFTMKEGNAGNCKLEINNNLYTVSVLDTYLLGVVTHSNGRLVLSNVHGIIPNGNGDSIVSTCDNTLGNGLYIRNVNFENFFTGVFGKINKTGNCNYVIGGSNRNPLIDILNGTRIHKFTAEDLDLSGINFDADEVSYTPDENTDWNVVPSFVNTALDELASRIKSFEALSPLNFKGAWDASTNTPDLNDVANREEGFFYKVSVAGTTNIDGENDWQVGDQAYFVGGEFIKIDNTDQVTSVNNKQGAVVLGANDIDESTTRFWSKKNNMEATLAPTVNDDIDAGYSIGSFWQDITNETLYVCKSNIADSAVWRRIPFIKPSLLISALDIDWSKGDVFYKDISVNSTFTFSNISEGQVIIVTIRNTSGAGVSVTLPSGIYKASDLSLSIDAGKESVFTFMRSNSKTYVSSVVNVSNA